MEDGGPKNIFYRHMAKADLMNLNVHILWTSPSTFECALLAVMEHWCQTQYRNKLTDSNTYILYVLESVSPHGIHH